MQTLIKPMENTEEITPKLSTVEEYLDLEEASELKHEYYNGEIFEMVGGTTNHNKIAGNIYAHLLFAFRKQPVEVYINDVRLGLPEYNIYTYPDVMIVNGLPIYQGKGNTTITNPQVIIEVLSKSTEDYDRGKKFKFYRSIAELKEYIIIDQYTTCVEHFAKNTEGKWVFNEYKKEEEMLILESLNWQISLSDIYERINFNSEEN